MALMLLLLLAPSPYQCWHGDVAVMLVLLLLLMTKLLMVMMLLLLLNLLF